MVLVYRFGADVSLGLYVSGYVCALSGIVALTLEIIFVCGWGGGWGCVQLVLFVIVFKETTFLDNLCIVCVFSVKPTGVSHRSEWYKDSTRKTVNDLISRVNLYCSNPFFTWKLTDLCLSSAPVYYNVHEYITDY